MIGDEPNLKTGISWTARLGFLAVGALFLTLAVWATVTQINGAVIAVGTVVVTGNPKQVQHFDGGVIDEILVTEGDFVTENDILVRLDKTLLEANLMIYKARLADLIARKSRLRAEQNSDTEIEFERFPEVLTGVDATDAFQGQIEIFNARRGLQDGKEERLLEKIAQLENQIIGVEGVLAAKKRQLELISEELAAKVELADKGLIAAPQVASIERAKADIEGQISEHISEIAGIKNAIQEARIEMLLDDRDFTESIVEEQSQITTQIGELIQQTLSTEKQLDRVALRAPVSGVVHEMQVFTIGGVVPPGGTVLQIVPQGENLSFEVQIDPVSIDQVALDQNVRLVFSAFNQRTTPELLGTVSRLSPTSITDQNSGLSYFKGEISIPNDELKKLEGLALVPGMPFEAFIQTGERSVLNYLIRPLMDHLQRAFREE